MGLEMGLRRPELTDSKNSPTAQCKSGRKDGHHPTLEEMPIIWKLLQKIMCSAEAYFLRAEGALLGWDMGRNAKDLYESGITKSMQQWGIADAAAIQSYINSSNTPIAPNDYLNSPAVSDAPVKFAADLATQKKANRDSKMARFIS